MSEVRVCNCDPSQCKTSDNRRRVHVGDECYHPNNIHHRINRNLVKNSNATNDEYLKRRRSIWNM